MLNLNRVMILGNATRAPESRFTPNGKEVANFAVATNRRWKDQTGNFQEQTEFHEVVAWGALAGISKQIIQKGSKLYVEGRLQTRTWETPDGNKRQKTEIIAENIIGLSPRSAGSTEYTDEAPAQAEETKHSTTKKESSSKEKKDNKETSEEEAIDLDDIPF
ncbi:single-stranded DNA-binding protein [Patescibacteria group bacterium]|nr:single-stranded DNA-binding protein [Patescibacteria group bacterium]